MDVLNANTARRNPDAARLIHTFAKLTLFLKRCFLILRQFESVLHSPGLIVGMPNNWPYAKPYEIQRCATHDQKLTEQIRLQPLRDSFCSSYHLIAEEEVTGVSTVETSSFVIQMVYTNNSRPSGWSKVSDFISPSMGISAIYKWLFYRANNEHLLSSFS